MKKQTITFYVASDGKCFDTEEDCLVYEANEEPLYTLYCWNLVSNDWQTTRELITAEAVYLPTDEAVKQFRAQCKRKAYGLIDFMDVSAPGIYFRPDRAKLGLAFGDFLELNLARVKLKRLAETVYKKSGQ